ncbi:transposable element Tcb2 transposase [Trichonephila clavipes]|nr:transposable element Tcb2 transposase [Trichonephila clavipes]
MSQREHLTESETWRVDSQLEGDQTLAEVAEVSGISHSVISRIWKRFWETRNAGQCRRLATTFNEDLYLTLSSRRYRNMNATLLQQHLFSAIGTTVLTQSVRNWLPAEVPILADQWYVCVTLTSRYCRVRREWATVHEK